MYEHNLTFREAAIARIHCYTSGDCDTCPIGDICEDDDVNKEITQYLEYILDKLDNAGIKFEDVSSEEWVKILEGV